MPITVHLNKCQDIVKGTHIYLQLTTIRRQQQNMTQDEESMIDERLRSFNKKFTHNQIIYYCICLIKPM
jgi:hypothetical protein